jgi:hypothetical protein
MSAEPLSTGPLVLSDAHGAWLAPHASVIMGQPATRCALWKVSNINQIWKRRTKTHKDTDNFLSR